MSESTTLYTFYSQTFEGTFEDVKKRLDSIKTSVENQPGFSKYRNIHIERVISTAYGYSVVGELIETEIPDKKEASESEKTFWGNYIAESIRDFTPKQRVQFGKLLGDIIKVMENS